MLILSIITYYSTVLAHFPNDDDIREKVVGFCNFIFQELPRKAAGVILELFASISGKTWCLFDSCVSHSAKLISKPLWKGDGDVIFGDVSFGDHIWMTIIWKSDVSKMTTAIQQSISCHSCSHMTLIVCTNKNNISPRAPADGDKSSW